MHPTWALKRQQGESRQHSRWEGRSVIRQAEARKVHIHGVPGNLNEFLHFEKPCVGNFEVDLSQEYVHSAMVDEMYQLVASHLDKGIQSKVRQGEYVDFGKLVPKDRVLTVDNSCYEMVVCEGKTFWILASNNEITEISSFNRWEQAFRVYSDVYLREQREHPRRASELIQYSHLIHTAAQSFTWENVYI